MAAGLIRQALSNGSRNNPVAAVYLLQLAARRCGDRAARSLPVK